MCTFKKYSGIRKSYNRKITGKDISPFRKLLPSSYSPCRQAPGPFGRGMPARVSILVNNSGVEVPGQ